MKRSLISAILLSLFLATAANSSEFSAGHGYGIHGRNPFREDLF